MILKVMAFAAIGLLVLLRLARTRFGGMLFGVSWRTLDIVTLIILVSAGVLAVAHEFWGLLTVALVLLALQLAEMLKRRAARAASDPVRRAAPRRRIRRR